MQPSVMREEVAVPDLSSPGSSLMTVIPPGDMRRQMIAVMDARGEVERPLPGARAGQPAFPHRQIHHPVQPGGAEIGRAEKRGLRRELQPVGAG